MTGKTKNESCRLRKRQSLVAVAVLVVCFFCLINVQEAKAADPFGIAEFLGDKLVWAFNMLLYGVFLVFSWLLGVAGILFSWVITPDNVYRVLDNPAIHESWKLVRDFMNLAFILVLLFSAFCTIFQVEKYHLKNILLTVVIMALLVNFSFPISRFIIDVSNMMFYFIINAMLPGRTGSGIFAAYGDYSAITNIVNPKETGATITGSPTTYLMAMCAFTFILMITFMVIAVMFVIRLTVLGILIILSPAGFVGAIFPSTKHYADEWWSNLFKYAFFAPIMGFMMAVSLNILKYMGDQNIMKSFMSTSGNNAADPSGANVFGNMAFFAIPVVLLWTGLSIAQKLSIAGAAVVTGKAKGVAKWVGGTLSGYNAVKKQAASFSAARKERESEKAKNRWGGSVGKWLNEKQDRAIGMISVVGRRAQKRADKMQIDANKKSIDEGAKDLIDKGGDAHTLGHSMNSDFNKKTSKKDILDQAKQATAFKRQDYNEKRNFVRSVVHNATVAGRDRLDNIINISADDIGLDSASTDAAMIAKVAAYNAEQTAIQAHITHVKAAPGNTLTNDQLEEVTAYINKQMGRKIKIGTDAK